MRQFYHEWREWLFSGCQPDKQIGTDYYLRLATVERARSPEAEIKITVAVCVGEVCTGGQPVE